MKELEEAGWKECGGNEDKDNIPDLDVKQIFDMVDLDKSGNINGMVRFQLCLCEISHIFL